jgi:hypothetical protein
VPSASGFGRLKGTRQRLFRCAKYHYHIDGSYIQSVNRTTFNGGANGDDEGTVFSLSVVGLKPFVSFVAGSGKVEQEVEILG